jgi:hypothetical protein
VDDVGLPSDVIIVVNGEGAEGDGVNNESDLAVLRRLAMTSHGHGEESGVGDGERREKVPVLDLHSKDVPWKERRHRIDTALAWLKTELVSTFTTIIVLLRILV